MNAGRPRSGAPGGFDAAPPGPDEAPVRAMLRLYRRARNVSQMALALEIGIPQPNLACFEGGKSMNGRNTVRVIAWLFRVPGEHD